MCITEKIVRIAAQLHIMPQTYDDLYKRQENISNYSFYLLFRQAVSKKYIWQRSDGVWFCYKRTIPILKKYDYYTE